MNDIAHKKRACSYCGSNFIPFLPLQNVCGPYCASKKVRADRKKENEKLKLRKAASKRIPELIAEAQKDFNAYIRYRDKDRPCICCGRTWTNVVGLKTHGWDAGHYRSTGSAPHLRFDENNCHRQLVWCNRYGAGRAVDYRIGLIARIGIAAVEALEAKQGIHKWTRDELLAIRVEYRDKLAQLKLQERAES